MDSAELDQRINGFLNRKNTEFPDLAVSGRHDSRTVKYASRLRASGQILFTR